MWNCLGSTTPDISQWIQIKNKAYKHYKHLQKHAYNKTIESSKMSSIFGKLLVGLFFFWLLFTYGKKNHKLKYASALQIFNHFLQLIIRNLFSFSLNTSNNSFHYSLDRPKYSTAYYNSQKDFLKFCQNFLFFTSPCSSWLYSSFSFIYKILPQ